MVYIFDEDITNKEAWLIAYNYGEKNILHLAKINTCIENLECIYHEDIMKEIDRLVSPTCLKCSLNLQ